MAQRIKGEGSIFWRENRQRWVGQIDLIDDDGKRRFRTVTGHTKKEAADKLKALRKELDLGGTVTAADITFANVFNAWIVAIETKVQKSTIDTYKTIAEAHLIPTLGKKPIAKLRPGDLEKVLKRMAHDGYRKGTLIKVRMIARQSVDWAVKRRSVSWNPFKLAEIPRVETPDRQRTSLSPDEVRRVLAAAGERRNGALLVVGLTTGLRPGELTALPWDSIDLEKGTVHVWRAWKGEGDNRVLAEPKTQGSIRTIGLAPVAVDALVAHRQEQVRERLAGRWPTDWDDHGGLVFVSETGTPIDPSNLRKLFARIAKAAKVDKFTPYMMRHTATSLLADAGIPNEQLADLLGHRTTRMVELHYRHRLKTSVDVAAAPMQQIFGT